MRYKDRPPTHTSFVVRNRSSRNGSPVRGIAVHTTESADIPHSADDIRGVRNWFNNPASQASSWIGVDGDGRSELWVPGAQKAWTMGHYEINAQTLNIEFVGRAAQPASAWEPEQLKTGAKWAAYAILNYDFVEIPNNVGRGHIKRGPSIDVMGILRHKDLTDAGVGTHVDPGPEFPMSDFISFTNYYIDNGWELGVSA